MIDIFSVWSKSFLAYPVSAGQAVTETLSDSELLGKNIVQVESNDEENHKVQQKSRKGCPNGVVVDNLGQVGGRGPNTPVLEGDEDV